MLGNGSGFYAQTMSPLIFKERVRERFLVPGSCAWEWRWFCNVCSLTVIFPIISERADCNGEIFGFIGFLFLKPHSDFMRNRFGGWLVLFSFKEGFYFCLDTKVDKKSRLASFLE